MYVLHQNKVGIGKSIPMAKRFPELGRIERGIVMVAMLERQDMPLEGIQWMCMKHSLLGDMHFQCYSPIQALGGTVQC